VAAESVAAGEPMQHTESNGAEAMEGVVVAKDAGSPSEAALAAKRARRMQVCLPSCLSHCVSPFMPLSLCVSLHASLTVREA